MNETTTSSTRTTPLLGRLIGALRLNRDIYEEVEHDRSATSQAALVVIFSSVAVGAGLGSDTGITGIATATVGGVVGWALYAWITYQLGTRLLATSETSATWGELARTLGFAYAPRALFLFSGAGIPLLTAAVGLITTAWLVATTLTALQAALELGVWRALVTAVLALIAQTLLLGIAVAIGSSLAGV